MLLGLFSTSAQGGEEFVLLGPGPVTQAEFGGATCLNGDLVVVGAYLDDPFGPGVASNAGAAYVFRRHPTLGWMPEATLTHATPVAHDNLGSAVAIEGDWALIGAFSDEGPAPAELGNAGSALVFNRGSGGAWSQQQVLHAGAPQHLGGFGWSISMSDGCAAVGSWYFDNNPGTVHIFSEQGGAWNLTQVLQAPNPVVGDRYGFDVSMDGAWLVVGASRASVGGEAYVYRKGAGGWTLDSSLAAPSLMPGDDYGHAVGLAGTRAIVGAPEADAGGVVGSGAAFVFDLDPLTGLWTHSASLVADTPLPDASLGFAVDVEGATAVLGAPFQDTATQFDAGSGFVFRELDHGWVEQFALIGSTATGAARQGHSVSLDGDRMVLGSPSIGQPGTAGQAFVFHVPELPATEVPRLGTPGNPQALLPGQTQAPVLGALWDPVIDHSVFMPSALLDVLVIAPAGANIPTPIGTLLCSLVTPPLLLQAAPNQPFVVPIPAQCQFVGASVCAQGASLDPLEIRLTNALDVVIGSLEGILPTNLGIWQGVSSIASEVTPCLVPATQ